MKMSKVVIIFVLFKTLTLTIKAEETIPAKNNIEMLQIFLTHLEQGTTVGVMKESLRVILTSFDKNFTIERYIVIGNETLGLRLSNYLYILTLLTNELDKPQEANDSSALVSAIHEILISILGLLDNSQVSLASEINYSTQTGLRLKRALECRLPAYCNRNPPPFYPCSCRSLGLGWK
ncbi:uncharacterized protein LOC106072923 isoform X1 [Biomphalaria glabrata]|uniref:Uncharacterized protein LOC106072923 isoform X1 n=1 Tax=Biomphalaria glabrata TaxID=6526 RepID=A0A9W3BG86_BIOGL|nr:uncharacterized protein LOC106072923 isoform X1 [Biomphalaria glabrata]XP_055898456.1 uncharacterized protein LOC106072923 isoform X1 [Biomphalaria glabrata]